jgi:GDP-D-mannose dehydratase
MKIITRNQAYAIMDACGIDEDVQTEVTNTMRDWTWAELYVSAKLIIGETRADRMAQTARALMYI